MVALTLQQIRKGTGWPKGARFVMVPASTRRVPSPRQTEVAQCLADGLTMREAAEAMGISHDTARTHAEAFRRRTKARTMSHAMAIGFRQGWLT